VRIAGRGALVITWATLVGCGSRSDSLTPADEAFLGDFCTLVEACCVGNGQRPTADVDSCKAQFAQNGFSRDPSLQSACLAELRDLASAGFDCVPQVWMLSDPCLRVLYEPTGSTAPGQLCRSKADCAGSPGAVTVCDGICLLVTPGQAGDGPCLGVVKTDGLVSVAAGLQPTPPPIVTGVVCEQRTGLYCEGPTDRAPMTCARLLAGGEACDYSDSCASGICNGGQFNGSFTGTCAPVASTGQACGDLTSGICDDASYCDSSQAARVCVAKLPTASACIGDDMCTSGHCVSGACSAETADEYIALSAFCVRPTH
jgi:Dickkopf-like protein